jgi:thymidylate synthase (FAD)
MTEPDFRDYMTVRLIGGGADDASVVAAARVSTAGLDSLEYLEGGADEGSGLINFLMRNRHGTPFEHNQFRFYIHAPIFVFREFQRHRVGWSYNEESGRYTKLEPVFYIPSSQRKLVQEGKTGEYRFRAGNKEQHTLVAEGHKRVARQAYANYLRMLDMGVAKEVARMTLPLNLYSSMYATCNARSLMAFLGLRTERDEATFRSTPMREIEMVAEDMEDVFEALMPITHSAFNNSGRVCP